MKGLTVAFSLFLFSPAFAFTSLYVFGDGACTTTNNFSLPYDYYGNRYCNGRVWVEVLAQRQGLTYESNKNWSYFGHYSPNLIPHVATFTNVPDAATALVAIWVNNADFVYDMNNYYPYNSSSLANWTNAMNLSLANHVIAVQTLYSNGVRTLLMPNAVDVTEVPFYSGRPAADKIFVRQRVMDFNQAFAAKMSSLQSSLPGLTIYVPDTFSLLDDMIANAANYGLTNALYLGNTVDALEDSNISASTNGPGTNYIFWDYLDPTAKAHVAIANLAQQLISPVRIGKITAASASNRLDIVNVPVGLNGFVDGSSNFLNWTSLQGFSSSNTTQTVFVPRTSADVQSYRLRFPCAWSWP